MISGLPNFEDSKENNHFLLNAKIIPITPRSTVSGQKSLPLGHPKVALEQNPNPTQ
jgi:hypothetical protein